MSVSGPLSPSTHLYWACSNSTRLTFSEAASFFALYVVKFTSIGVLVKIYQITNPLNPYNNHQLICAIHMFDPINPDNEALKQHLFDFFKHMKNKLKVFQKDSRDTFLNLYALQTMKRFFSWTWFSVWTYRSIGEGVQEVRRAEVAFPFLPVCGYMCVVK